MFALLLLGIVAVPLVTLVVLDQRRLRQQRSVERGLYLVSQRASRRLNFRRPLLSDVEFFLEMASDPVAADANGWREDEAAVVAARFANTERFKRLRDDEIVAIEQATGLPVGTATFSTSPLGDRSARSIGIHVHPDHCRQGYGREIMAAAILLMQYTPGPIHVGTRTTNIGMQRIMEQLGYEAHPQTHPYTAVNADVYEAYWYHCGTDVHPPAGLFELPADN